MEEVLAHHTGQPIERIAKDTDRDYIVGAADAVAYGLVDEVLLPRNRDGGRVSPSLGYREPVVAAHP